MFSIVQLSLNLLRLEFFSKNKTKARAIPNVLSENYFHVLSGKLYHLKKDMNDFIRISSIHGIRNLQGGFKEKIFWLAAIVAATASFVYYSRYFFEALSQNEVAMQFDSEPWNSEEVFTFMFLGR